MSFSNLHNTSKVLVVIAKNIRVTAGGASFMNTYSPLIKYSGNARQKLAYNEFNNYTSILNKYLGNSSNTETLQFLTSNDNEMDPEFNYANITIDFYVQQDKIIYDYYPSGILTGLSKLGGLIAIFNISIFLKFMH